MAELRGLNKSMSDPTSRTGIQQRRSRFPGPQGDGTSVASTCKHCTHWQTRHYMFAPPITVCDNLGHDDFRIEATAADDTDLSAELITGPDFGCVKFTAKQ